MSEMTIHLIVPVLWTNAYSMFVYAENIKAEYEKLGHTVKWRQPKLKKITTHKGINSFLTRYFFYPMYLRKNKIYKQKWVFHIVDHSYSYLLDYLDQERTVVTCHDIIPLIFASTVNKHASKVFKRNIFKIRKARAVLCDSQSTKDDLVHIVGLNAEKLHVVYLAYNSWLFTYHEKQQKNTFTVMIIGAMFYKNIMRILEAITLLSNEVKNRIKINKIQPFTAQEKEYIKKNLPDTLVNEHVGISNNSIADLYKESDLLIFTSLYEWFGLPILESMASWTPVLTSPISSMPELGGDAALYAQPTDSKDIADKIDQLATNEQLYKEFVWKWLEQVKKFSRSKCAQENLTVYLSLNK